MDLSRKLQLLDEQVAVANEGIPADFTDWKNQTDVVLRAVLGAKSPLYTRFLNIPTAFPSGSQFAPYKRAAVQKVISLLKAAQREVELTEESKQSEAASAIEELIDVSDKGTDSGGRIFIVHGHDQAKKFQLARFLKDLTGHEPVILHEQPNKGAVLIEKLEANASGTGFAVVLLTADDTGKANTEDDYRPRGRQNVVFELGFFMAALGRSNVAVLMDPGVEEPGDVKGLVYTPLDAGGAWKTALATEIEEAGIPVEWKALKR